MTPGQATEFIPAHGVDPREVADAAQLSSIAGETPEGRSIVVLAKEKYGIREREMHTLQAEFVPFTAQTRMSGVDLDGREIRKGATDAVERYVTGNGGTYPAEVRQAVETVSKGGARRSSWPSRTACSAWCS